MLFAITEKDGCATPKMSARTVVCVAAICVLAATPLMVSFSLTLWGG
ncbi:MAG TPA: hypothetical protein VEH76_12865 [Methylocystis sp.]|nr:hypothetical protein [Methylocystis sp.]